MVEVREYSYRALVEVVPYAAEALTELIEHGLRTKVGREERVGPAMNLLVSRSTSQ